MTFWIAAALLLGLTCLALIVALGRDAVATGGHDRAFYQQQIAEIDRQAALKLIGEREAEAARTEAARRLLAASDGSEAADAGTTGGRRLAAVVVLVVVPAVSLPLYLARGTPDAPSMPLASREKPGTQPGEGGIMAALEKIETHLARNPDDGRGHEVVAPIYLRMGRTADAVRAFSAAVRLLGPTADRQANLAEALIYQGQGIVTAEARVALEAATALDAKHVKARFFLALAAQQDGDRTKAVSLLQGLRGDLPDGPLKEEIGRQLAELTETPAGGEAIAALPQADQQAAIRGMVENLAQRLATTGGSAEEWARLIRALTVLKDNDRAQTILAEARQRFASEPEALKRIEEAGRAP